VSTNNWITHCLQWSQTVQQGAFRAWLRVMQELGWKSDKEGLPLAKLCEMLTTEVSAADVLDALYPQRQKKPLLNRSTQAGDLARVKPRPVKAQPDDALPKLGGVAAKSVTLLSNQELHLPTGQNVLSRSAYYHQPPVAKRHVTRGLIADDELSSQSAKRISAENGWTNLPMPHEQQYPQQQAHQVSPRSVVATQEASAIRPTTHQEQPIVSLTEVLRHDNPFQNGLTGNYTDIYLKHVENMALLRKLQTAINQREGAPI